MTFVEMKTELYSRGANYLEESSIEITRAERWLNQAYREILNLHAWPFLMTSDGGSCPVQVSALRKVLSVYVGTTDNTLTRASRQELIRDGHDLAQTGSAAQFWYLDFPGNIINIWPVSGEILTVEYILRATPLTDDEEPAFDEEYHNLIVDKAMIKVYIDSDNFDAANALKAETDAALVAMAEDYLLSSTEPSYIDVINPRDG